VDKINYQNKLLEIVKDFKEDKPRFHSCCGPCSTQVLSFLVDYFTITVYYYNPNIEPEDEYLKRKGEQIKFIQAFNKEHDNKIAFLESDYENIKYRDYVKGLEEEPEGRARCSKCFYLRIYETARRAKKGDFEYFGTTLTVSPHKNSQVINKIGEVIAEELDIKYIYGDFKKNDGYKKSIEYSKKYDLYRQNYCGCLFSLGDKYEE